MLRSRILIFWNPESSLADVDIPTPDYGEEEEEVLEENASRGGGVSNGIPLSSSPDHVARIYAVESRDTDNLLVSPKKLVNPVLNSKERQDLHKELLLNQKLWVSSGFKNFLISGGWAWYSKQ